MKLFTIPILATLLGAAACFGQVTVSVDDLKLGEGARRAYATHAGGTAFVDGLIGLVGGPQQWDFTNGPLGNRYDYEIVSPSESPVSGPFVGAGRVERQDREFEEATGWTFYNVGAQGRALHGFHDAVANPANPDVIFDQPIVDLPSAMAFLDEWSATTSYPTQLDVGGLVVDMVITLTINSVVDGFGTLTLPGLGEIEVLRVNELSSQTPIADIGGMPVQLERVFSRSYLWISKEYGIVAQMTSEGATTVPPAEFEIAARFIRLIECFEPDSPSDPKLRIELVNGVAVLTWDQLSSASAYEIYTSSDLQAGSSELLGTTFDTRFLDAVASEQKYYWLVPLEQDP